MKKLTTHSKVLALMLLTLAFCALIFTACSANTDNDLSSQCIRIHIRANSNSQLDQQIKLAVRDEITAYLTDILIDAKTKNQALMLIEKNKQNMTEIANSTLKAHNFDYTSTVSVKNEHFPDREYDGYVFPEGNYDALIIELGEGVGNNWWCVAFPPLCFVPDSNNGEKIVYKSWVKEKLEQLFG